MWGTAPGLLALLTEKNLAFCVHALESLHLIVETEWPQIADDLQRITDLAEDGSPLEAKDRKIAALLASKTYYHLGDSGVGKSYYHLSNLDKAVQYAIAAGDRFDPSNKDEFTERVVAHAIKTYIHLLNATDSEKEKEKLPALRNIVEGVLQNMLSNHQYSECLCLAIETMLPEYVKLVLNERPGLVAKAITLSLNTVIDSKYRQELLRLYVDFAMKTITESPATDCDKVWFQLSQLYHALEKPDDVAHLLEKLKRSSKPDNWLLAYQIAFELAENASQKFRRQVYALIPAEMEDLQSIITRRHLLDLYLNFLFKNNKSDIHVIVALKETLDASKMLVHSSVIIAYSFMFAGTGDDNFYRNNTQWFSNGKKWAQFITIAAVGAIHIGHLKAALQVLHPFLTNTTPAFALGGCLYALGLIYANYSWDTHVLEIVKDRLTDHKPSSVAVKHGGCLALGLIAMGSQDEKYYKLVWDFLNDPSPEAGEAAGYAIGMIMLGCGNCPQLDDLRRYCENCPHEKVTRGGAMGLALMMYGREEDSETLVECLLTQRIPLLRESAAWVTALAYVGTASNVALQRLLHLAVSDVNPDVRRAAVIGVGFVLSRSPKEVPGMVDLLAKSYHPHVRSGAALALGISCAGTGMPEAIEILKPLLDDLEDFVKQSAMIAMAMVLQQQSDMAVPYAKQFRMYLRRLISKKRNDLQVFGLCLAYGVLNAGGRNVVISSNSLRGENSVLSTVGLALFCNYFYWHPLALMLPLAFHPTAVIGLDKKLEVARWKIVSRGDPRLYEDPPTFESEKEVEKIQKAAVLSISKKEVEQEPAPPSPPPVPEKVVDWKLLENPSRVTLNQLASIDPNFCEKYYPITGEVFHGFVMLKEREGRDDEEEDLKD